MTMCLLFPVILFFSPFTKPSENVILQLISSCVFFWSQEERQRDGLVSDLRFPRMNTVGKVNALEE